MTAAARAHGTRLRRGLVEAEILERSAELFAARGFAATSMQDIADALGSSRPALYHYFRSKDQILDRLIEGLAESAEPAVSAATAVPGSAASRLRALVTALIAPVAESPGRFRMILTSDATVSRGARDRLRKLERTVVHAMSDVLDDGVASGEFRPGLDRTATFGILGMINWVAWWYSPGRDLSTDELCESIAEMAVASVRAAGAAPPGRTPHEIISSLRTELGHLERVIARDESPVANGADEA
jgi:AcrR family transcriptional regulator